ncbi:MAG TPA: PhzF family phenazine biosynthesis protein [Clostridiaceae bacterium]|jgi:PhzF family phenazine biosynthesis protein|nr:PhzF family phenazine biosynthesis protein [Clostridiaceae bacterium]
MMKIKVYQLNSFARVSGGGNPAAVVLDAENLTEKMMQETARKIGLSETAFVMGSKIADYKIRYFTPLAEVGLCGHATIAVFSLLRELKIIGDGDYTFETIRAVLGVNISGKDVLMDMQRAEFYEYIDVSEVADTLNVPEDLLLPLAQVVSTGLKDLIIPVKSKSVLDAIQPDFRKIGELSAQHGIEGYHLFALDEEVTAVTRNFAPLLGILEESATGTASGALAAYLYSHGLLSETDRKNIVFRQGESMGRPSHIRVVMDTSENVIEKIQVGGGVMDISSYFVEL